MNEGQEHALRESIRVIQVGARHHYAIPRMFARRGWLDCLVTDTCPGVGPLARLAGIIPRSLMPGVLRRWSSRVPTGIPLSKIRVSGLSGLAQLPRRFGIGRDHWDEDGLIFRAFERACLRHGFGNSKVIYAMLFETSPAYLEAAKAQGCKIVLDVYITPAWHRIVSRERADFPHWEGAEPIRKEAFEARLARQLELADVVLCPGENVVDGLRHFPTFDETKVVVMPYGCGIDFKGRRNTPQPGRILFAGTADLRKGLPHLAKAAGILAGRAQHYHFRVAGGVTDHVRNLPECRHLEFLGRVPRPAMADEFMAADVFVFPTLAEGCASVVHEALAAGLPVVTTRAAGSIIQSGRGGLIVPERDPQALADAIISIVEDRACRERLAAETSSYHDLLTEAHWEHSLVNCMEQLV